MYTVSMATEIQLYSAVATNPKIEKAICYENSLKEYGQK